MCLCVIAISVILVYYSIDAKVSAASIDTDASDSEDENDEMASMADIDCEDAEDTNMNTAQPVTATTIITTAMPYYLTIESRVVRYHP
jgi:hypothetical protein